jgi:4-diphosphocytidyl-2-C-methyl-D-erythritol kinase
MTTTLTALPAPAKINLFLHVVGRRADGYHLLQSLFVLVDWHDTIDLSLRTDGRLTREDVDTRRALPAHDLCMRAADALRQATGCTLGAHIRLHKRIPTEAGLGGGSSDAATCLIGLNRLWNLGLHRPDLARIALTLGADVPFFIGGHNAWVEGVGEALTPVNVPPTRFVIVKPAAGASTAQIFSSPNLKRDTKPATMQGFAADDVAWNVAALLGQTRNDLQAVAQALCPDVGRCIDWLASQGLQGRMTGSGTAVFAPLPAGFGTLAPLPDGWVARICSSLDRHPLADWITG